MSSQERRILLAISGASGSLYGEILLRFLLGATTCRIYLVASEIGKKVVDFELSSSNELGSLVRILSGDLLNEEKDRLRIFDDKDFFAPVASGTSVPSAMVVVPCSMGTLGRIAAGMSSSLIERSADVMLKQKQPLLICPRESPLSQLHLENMLRLAKLGVQIIPLMPAMYQKPKTVEDVVRFSVGRVCEALGYTHQFYAPWNKRRC